MWLERIFSDHFPEPATMAILTISFFVMFGLFKKNQGPRVS